MAQYGDSAAELSICSPLTVTSMPWTFSQRHLLDTSDFIREAERRGCKLDLSTLRELYRHGLLVPFVAIRDRRASDPIPLTDAEKRRAWNSTRLAQLYDARAAGKLLDLSGTPFRPRLQFDRVKADPRRWWNGLIYTWYQLAVLPELLPVLEQRRYTYRDDAKRVRLPTPHQYLVTHMARFWRVAVAATALEARYLPSLDPEWIQLTNTEVEDWVRYRSDFDPVAMSGMLGYPAAQARQDAEHLLTIARRVDPLGDDWSRLIRRSPASAQKGLKNAALSAMDLRVTAEILVRFYEDLAARGLAEPLPELEQRGGWYPTHERLSYRPVTLDRSLMDLGISPHPRVVLAVEGDTEESHVPKIMKLLEFSDAPELVRVLNLGGTKRDIQKLAVLAATPLVSHKGADGEREFWWLIKPPTCFMVAADPENQFGPDKVEETRKKTVEGIKQALEVQRVQPDDAEIQGLLEIHTWTQSCYEFAHFTDQELAEGIRTVHLTCDGWSEQELIDALAYWRRLQKDIRRVWDSGRWDPQLGKPSGKWDYEVSKTKLAEALWPALEQKIRMAMTDETAPVPEIVDVVQHAYHKAQSWRYRSFVLPVK